MDTRDRVRLLGGEEAAGGGCLERTFLFDRTFLLDRLSATVRSLLDLAPALLLDNRSVLLGLRLWVNFLVVCSLDFVSVLGFSTVRSMDGLDESFWPWKAESHESSLTDALTERLSLPELLV